MFYRSHMTEVFASRCSVVLSFRASKPRKVLDLNQKNRQTKDALNRSLDKNPLNCLDENFMSLNNNSVSDSFCSHFFNRNNTPSPLSSQPLPEFISLPRKPKKYPAPLPPTSSSLLTTHMLSPQTFTSPVPAPYIPPRCASKERNKVFKPPKQLTAPSNSEDYADEPAIISWQFSNKWRAVKSGLLLLILDSGINSRRHRKLYLALAEVGTGFMLWKDVVDYLSEYQQQESTFHTMHLSHDHNTLAGTIIIHLIFLVILFLIIA